jgi:CheY-like chemotaxis protein
MTYILSEEGCEIISSSDSSIIKQLQTINPAMVFMDNRLTDGFGRDFCRQIKSDPETSRFPVVLFSANMDLEKIASDSWADAYLAKPFDMADLLAIAKRFC